VDFDIAYGNMKEVLKFILQSCILEYRILSGTLFYGFGNFQDFHFNHV
jgi:hypothetical protein